MTNAAKLQGMKVYAVIGDDWEDSYVESIWTTKKAAEKRRKECAADESLKPFVFTRVEEYEVQE